MNGPLIPVAAIIWCALAIWTASARGWLDPYIEFFDDSLGPIWDTIKRATVGRASDRRLAMDIGPLPPPGSIEPNTGASLSMRDMPLGMARLAVAFGGCPHPNAVPVETWDGERVAVLCPDCDVQLPAEWETQA